MFEQYVSSAGNDYTVGTGLTLRTPVSGTNNATGSYAFGGDSLTLGGTPALVGTAGTTATYTVNNFVLGVVGQTYGAGLYGSAAAMVTEERSRCRMCNVGAKWLIVQECFAWKEQFRSFVPLAAAVAVPFIVLGILSRSSSANPVIPRCIYTGLAASDNCHLSKGDTICMHCDNPCQGAVSQTIGACTYVFQLQSSQCSKCNVLAP